MGPARRLSGIGSHDGRRRLGGPRAPDQGWRRSRGPHEGILIVTLTSKRILVTGGGGFLGSHLLENLRQGGCKDIIAPRRREFDLTQAEAIERLFHQYRPEVVIHGAASVGGIGANRDNPGLFFYENAIMGIQ